MNFLRNRDKAEPSTQQAATNESSTGPGTSNQNAKFSIPRPDQKLNEMATKLILRATQIGTRALQNPFIFLLDCCCLSPIKHLLRAISPKIDFGKHTKAWLAFLTTFLIFFVTFFLVLSASLTFSYSLRSKLVIVKQKANYVEDYFQNSFRTTIPLNIAPLSLGTAQESARNCGGEGQKKCPKNGNRGSSVAKGGSRRNNYLSMILLRPEIEVEESKIALEEIKANEGSNGARKLTAGEEKVLRFMRVIDSQVFDNYHLSESEHKVKFRIGIKMDNFEKEKINKDFADVKIRLLYQLDLGEADSGANEANGSKDPKKAEKRVRLRIKDFKTILYQVDAARGARLNGGKLELQNLGDGEDSGILAALLNFLNPLTYVRMTASFAASVQRLALSIIQKIFTSLFLVFSDDSDMIEVLNSLRREKGGKRDGADGVVQPQLILSKNTFYFETGPLLLKKNPRVVAMTADIAIQDELEVKEDKMCTFCSLFTKFSIF